MHCWRPVLSLTSFTKLSKIPIAIFPMSGFVGLINLTFGLVLKSGLWSFTLLDTLGLPDQIFVCLMSYLIVFFQFQLGYFLESEGGGYFGMKHKVVYPLVSYMVCGFLPPGP